jgi:Phosphoribosylamine-glycine ligase
MALAPNFMGKNKILTNGGRVLNVITIQNNINIAREFLYNNIKKIKWKGSFYRRDIGT